MTSKGKASAVLILFVLLSLLWIVDVRVEGQPRSDLEITWFTSETAAYDTLKAGQVDLMQWSLSKAQREDTQIDPNLQLGRRENNDMFEFDLNNNKTIADYPTSLNPLHVKEVRQAIARLVDKNYIINTVLQQSGVRIDAPISYPQIEPWVYPNVVTYDWNHNGIIELEEDKYPYNYNVDAAVDLLAGLGFNDTDGNGYLNYPNNPMWMNAAAKDTTQMPLKMCIRSDQSDRRMSGEHLMYQLEGDFTIAGDGPLATSPRWVQLGRVGGDFDTTKYGWVREREPF